tara:strand:+ start:808 stop:1074 length:267 start_codon:yes stop_codon:yes gene_type:complete
MKYKKAQLSMQTIVALIIALTVLIAIILFFTGKFATLGGNIDAVSPDEQLSTTAECQLACNLAKSTDNPQLWEDKTAICADVFECDLS